MNLLVLPEHAVNRTVFSVDDSWFEPQTGRDATVTRLSNVLAGQTSPVRPDQLIASLTSEVTEVTHSDYRTAMLLLQQCVSRQFKLEFASFEYFEEYFDSTINWPGNALLLDCNFQNDLGRGPILLDRLLKGRRPACDVFLLTGDLQTARGTTRDLSWAVRHVPVVGKVAAPPGEWESEVRAFLDYFLEGSRVDPHVLVANYQVTLDYKSLAHPDTETDIPEDLRSWVTDGERVHLESFKALFTPYWYKGKNCGHRLIRLGILKTVLERVGFRVTLNDQLRSIKVHLPTQPGCVFIIALLRFCRHEDLRPRGHILDVTIALDNEQTIASVQFPFQGSALHASTLLGKGGEITRAFQELLACDWRIIQKYATDTTLAQTVVDSWLHDSVRADPRDWASQLSLTPSFSSGHLTLSWRAKTPRLRF